MNHCPACGAPSGMHYGACQGPVSFNPRGCCKHCEHEEPIQHSFSCTDCDFEDAAAFIDSLEEPKVVKAVSEWTPEERLSHIYEVLAHAVWDFAAFEAATTLPEQASRYNSLANSMSDLATWHPDYNPNTGEIDEGAE